MSELRIPKSEGALVKRLKLLDDRFAYNHIVCPPMVLWLGEAAGVQRTKLLEAKRAALSAGASLPALSAAIRKTIPWEQIESRLKKLGAG